MHSKSNAKRITAFRNLEMLGAITWNDTAAMMWLESKLDREPYYLLNAWLKSTMKYQDGNTYQLQRQRQKELLRILEQGLADGNPLIRLSSAKALIPIGKEFDLELGFPTNIDWSKTGFADVTRLLNQAAKSIETGGRCEAWEATVEGTPWATRPA